jgi:predicted metal-dependent phosphoesterase TrpH
MHADLHTHSSRSDGILAPAELVMQATSAGLECIALTDHDTVAGIGEAVAAARTLGSIQVIVGVELSVRDASGIEDHLLGLFIDPDAPSLQAYLTGLQRSRERMAERTIELLASLGVPVSRERVAELAAGAVVTRPHIARAMVEAAHVASEQEAFERYLGSGKPAAEARSSPDPATAIAAVHNAGGVAGLAHPVFAQDAAAAERLAGLPARLDALLKAGMQAMECDYPDAPSDLRLKLRELARERGLIATGGSDYHGPDKAPFAELGSVTVDGQVVDALRALRRSGS